MFTQTILLIGYGCTREEIPVEDHFVFLGHIYDANLPNRVNPELEKVDFAQFDVRILGGDLCIETTQDRETLNYLDSLFLLSSPNTLWALGNHDIRNGHLDWIEETTQRPSFFLFTFREVVFLILNTNWFPNECMPLNEQYQLFEELEFYLQDSRYLIVISHHVIWFDYVNSQGVASEANANHSWWQLHCHTTPSGFEEAVYPILHQLSGDYPVEILCIAGDFGQKSSRFQYRDSNGIWFLGNGLDNTRQTSPDSLYILQFTYRQDSRELNWEFTGLSRFVEKYGSK